MSESATAPAEPSERWLPVVGFEGRYEISDLGRVRSLRGRGGAGPRILRPGKGKYLTVRLYGAGTAETLAVHRLVGEAFIGPLPTGEQTRHGPGGRFDNRLVNISYGTQAENDADKFRDGTAIKGDAIRGGRLTSALALSCRQRAARGEALRALALEYGVSDAVMEHAVSAEIGAGEVDPDSRITVWRQVAAILRGRIESGYYPPGRRIASKNEAMQEFGVADKTYDHAIAALRDEGLIETVPGKGSFVIERDESRSTA